MKEIDIDEIVKKISTTNAKWEAAKSRFTDLSANDRKQLLGYYPGPDDPSLEDRERISKEHKQAELGKQPATADIPISYDLRNVGGQNYITLVKDQKRCGSCVAFALAAAAEGTLRRQRNDPNLQVDYSEAHLFYCHGRSEGRNCSNGWWTGKALDAFKTKGVVDEGCYPYTAGDQNCSDLCSDWQNRITKITNWRRITSTNEMKKWISTKGPLIAAFTVYDDFYAYKKGIYRHVTGEKSGGHAVCCVGYNDTEQYWICKNSWNDTFGENGFFRIAYGEVGIDAYMDAIETIQ